MTFCTMVADLANTPRVSNDVALGMTPVKSMAPQEGRMLCNSPSVPEPLYRIIKIKTDP